MIVRRGPAIVLSLWLSAAALAMAPSAQASDGGTVKGGSQQGTTSDTPVKDTTDCSGDSTSKLKVATNDDGVLVATGSVWSDDGNLWDWKFKHNDDLSAKGETKADPDADKSFKVTRNMVNLIGPDHIVFRAENEADGEVCRVDVYY